jgi:hypothetical protein
MKTVGLLATLILGAATAQAGVFKIGGIAFNDANTVKTAAIVEGPVTLSDHSNPRFGRYSEAYVISAESQENEFQKFDRRRSLAWLMGRTSKSDLARHISFAEPGDSSGALAMPNIHRCSLELTWGKDAALPNGPGDDFVVYESGSWEGFAVAVRKVGDIEYTGYRYHFPKSFDTTHNVNAVVFDLTDFGLEAGDQIASIRIRNLFNADARAGADKVSGESGEGWVILPGDPRYKNSKEAFPLRIRAGGSEFKTDQLGPDIIYVAGLQAIGPARKQSNTTQEQPATQEAAKK